MAPVLTLPTGLGDFIVYCDASRFWLGCVLMQKGKQYLYGEHCEDYDLSIHYHLGKEKVVADALRRKSGGTLVHLPIAKEISVCAIARSSLIERVKAKQFEDPNLVDIRNGVQSKYILAFSLDEDGVLRMNGCLCVLDIDGLRNEIMAEAHRSKCSIHPGSIKMYKDLREIYWWNRMKENISDFVARCLNC
ncbi:PREDICTED: uncharacterized protein LOC109205862 [Nicotiana attenuata]|uniref:uncharacterized protein LOC109205862 n=1 Tax=Nicotiana attenuata TaxID=49451 RepID=UPI000904A1FF|nr:PREDICTED: uncharacterized protein LOC109205862 [Nicotiana attenuata]